MAEREGFEPSIGDYPISLAGSAFNHHLSGIVYSKSCVFDCLMESAAFSAIIMVGALVLPPIGALA